MGGQGINGQMPQRWGIDTRTHTQHVDTATTERETGALRKAGVMVHLYGPLGGIGITCGVHVSMSARVFPERINGERPSMEMASSHELGP